MRPGRQQALSEPAGHTGIAVPNVSIVAKLNNYFRKSVITTVITADTQCRIVVTNRHCNRDDT